MQVDEAQVAHARRGRFVVLEGLDGAGTTTLRGALARHLLMREESFLETCQPSDGPVGRVIRAALARKYPMPNGQHFTTGTLAELYAADRAWHLRNQVQPVLEVGGTVLSDRHVLSSLAYQGQAVAAEWGAEVDAALEWVANLNANLPHADLTLYLRVSPEVAARRRAARKGVELLLEDVATQARVADFYAHAIRLYGARENVVVVDGEAPAEEVAAVCLAHVEALLSGGEA